MTNKVIYRTPFSRENELQVFSIGESESLSFQTYSYYEELYVHMSKQQVKELVSKLQKWLDKE